MLTVFSVITVWLAASYLRPVPSASYDQASLPFVSEQAGVITSESEVLVAGDLDSSTIGLQ